MSERLRRAGLAHIAHDRLHNQRLSSAGFTTPEEVVSWLGAVQAQEYPGAKWALAQRMRRATDAAIEKAFTEGKIAVPRSIPHAGRNRPRTSSVRS